jgi:hypothetical protein
VNPASSEIAEPGSKVTLERFLQVLKQDMQSASTDEGMEIDRSPKHLSKAHWPIKESLGPASNVKSDSFPQ